MLGRVSQDGHRRWRDPDVDRDLPVSSHGRDYHNPDARDQRDVNCDRDIHLVVLSVCNHGGSPQLWPVWKCGMCPFLLVSRENKLGALALFLHADVGLVVPNGFYLRSGQMCLRRTWPGRRCRVASPPEMLRRICSRSVRERRVHSSWECYMLGFDVWHRRRLIDAILIL